MKKLMALMLVAVLVPCAFAQNAQEKAKAGAFQKALSKSVAKAAAANKEIDELKTSLRESVNYFEKIAYKMKYYNTGSFFQGLDQSRMLYMQLRDLSVTAAREMVAEINRPIQIDNGNRTIRIADYVRMESCVLGSYSPSIQEQWDDWSYYLEKDLKMIPRKGVATEDTPLQEGLPNDFAVAVKGFRSYVYNAEKMNSDWVLESMMMAMDTFNAYKKKGNVEQLEAMAKEFVKPVQSGWGETVYPIDFIIKHTCKLYGTVQYDLWQFASDLDALSR